MILLFLKIVIKYWKSVPRNNHFCFALEKSLYSIGMSTASIEVPNSSESVSYKKIDLTTTYAPVSSMTSWYPSSSVFLLPPTTVPQGKSALVVIFPVNGQSNTQE